MSGGGWVRWFELLVRPRPEPLATAIQQVRHLGFHPEDVRDIVVTHLDLDHAGGLPDFPAARVHVFRPEYEAAMAPAGLKERSRYRPVHWAHGPRGLAAFQWAMGTDGRQRRRNQGRLRALLAERGGEVQAHSAHCPVEIDRHASAAALPAQAGDGDGG